MFLRNNTLMVMTHRKLFPSESSANQTQNCYGVCDPACPYNCYSYPNYYFRPPPPPFVDHINQVNHVPSYMIIIVSLFTIIFAVAAFYVFKLKCYNDLCGRRVNRSIPSQSNNNEQFVNENQVDHPVWLITTVGLEQSIINSITVYKYKKDEGLIEGTECSVCLNEFIDGETLRVLPKCNHAFHIPCIDTWLRSHINCPLCRASIVSSNNVSVTTEAAMSNLASPEQESVNLGRNHDTHIDNSHNDGIGGSEEASEVREFNDESNSKDDVFRLLNDPNGNHDVLYDEIQDKTELLQVVNVLKQESDYSKKCKTMRSSSIEECLHISPVSMKRSFSYNGRILCSRSYMSLKNTLPYKNSQSIKYLQNIR